MNDPKVASGRSPDATASRIGAPAEPPAETGSFRGSSTRIVGSKKERVDDASPGSASFAAINEQAQAHSEPASDKSLPSGAEISTSAAEAKSGGLLKALRNLVRAIINFFLTPDANQAPAASGFPGWRELAERLNQARTLIEDTSLQVSNLSGADFKSNLGSDQNMLARLIEPAEAMQAFTRGENVRKLLAESDLPEARKKQLAANLQAGADALMQLMDAKFAPASDKSRDLLADSATFRDFASTDPQKNPYLILGEQFSSNDGILLDEQVRSWLNDALEIYDKAARMIESSLHARETAGSAAGLQKRINEFAGSKSA